MRVEVAARAAVMSDPEDNSPHAEGFPHCPICEGATRPWLVVPCDFARPLERRSYSLYWCVGCSYGLVWPRPVPAEITRFYEIDHYYTHSSAGGSAAAAPPPSFVDRVLLHLAWKLDYGTPILNSVIQALDRSRLAICDVGCGNGSLLMELQKSGHDVLGVEIDPVARQTASGRGLRVIEGTAETMPALAPASFDVVVMSHVLEHTLHPLQAIANAARLVKPEGRLIIEVPNNACTSLSERGAAWPWLDVPRHLNFFTSRSLRAIARSADLQFVKFEWAGYCRMFSEEWINEEKARWERFAAAGNTRMPPRASSARAWSLLLRTGLAQAERKYDSVRMVARVSRISEP